MFFPLPFPDRKVRIIGEFVLVFTMIVSFADRPFSGLRCYCLKVMSRIFLPKALCLLALAFASIPAGSISSPVQCFLFLLFVSFNFVLLHLTFNKAEKRVGNLRVLFIEILETYDCNSAKQVNRQQFQKQVFQFS